MRILESRYPVEDWARGMTPFEILISTILSQSTTVANERRGLNDLRLRVGAITPKRLAETPQEEIAKAIWHAGLAKQKAPRIRGVAKALLDGHGDRLERILGLPTERARELSVALVSDYVQLMKLRIDALLLLVAAAGYIATSGVAVDAWRFGLLILAGFFGAAGASATNHYLDRDLDSIMHRTRTRPLPQHRIEPPAHALELGVGLLVLSLAIAGFGINLLTALMIGLGYAIYIGVYTVGLKRAHVSNIVIGGFAGSCPALAGSAAAANSISLQP